MFAKIYCFFQHAFEDVFARHTASIQKQLFYDHHFNFSDGTKLSKRQGDIQISYFQVSTLYFGKGTYMYIYPCVSMCDIIVL